MTKVTEKWRRLAAEPAWGHDGLAYADPINEMRAALSLLNGEKG